jgi:ribosomal protein S18 acetylase RimI-like enzyme
MLVAKMITIREATEEDRLFLKAMIWEAIMASPSLVSEMGLEKLRQHEEESWNKWSPASEPAFIALDNDGRKLGAISLRAHEQEDEKITGWRFGIGVEAEARGWRIGWQLIERALAFSRATGARYLTLFVDPANIPARALYSKMGFIEMGETHGAIEMRVTFES